MLLGGGVALVLFLLWENRRVERGQGALIDPAMLRNLQLRNGVMSFLFMFMVQAGLFFAVPLFLSVALGLSAIETGVRLLPLSLSLLLFAAGIPKLWPHVSPQRVVRLGFVSLFAGLVLLVALLDVGVGPEIITWPLLLAGAGLGAMASQLGSVTVSSVPDEQSGEVGGLQNTGTQLGACDRHRARGRRADLGADRLVLHRHPGEPGRSGERHRAGGDRAGRRRRVRLRR